MYAFRLDTRLREERAEMFVKLQVEKVSSSLYHQVVIEVGFGFHSSRLAFFIVVQIRFRS